MLPGFEERRRALEDAFFREQDEKQLAALRDAQQKRETKEVIRESSGIDDDAVLDKLVELSLTAETVVALTLVPLIRVAWADGSVQDKEQKAIAEAAQRRGIDPSSPAHALLTGWLLRRPDAAFTDAWRDYVHALTSHLSDEQRAALRDSVVERARSVAEAAGGFLGIAAISAAEEAELVQIAKAFDPA